MGGYGGVVFYGAEFKGKYNSLEEIKDEDRVGVYAPYGDSGCNKIYIIYEESKRTQDDLGDDDQYIIPSNETFMGEVNMDAEIQAFTKKNNLKIGKGFHWFFVKDEIY